MSGEAPDNLVFFSANDRRIDPTDPVLRPPVNVDTGPRPRPLPESRPTDLSVLSTLRGAHVSDGQFPVRMEPDSGMLYSFTLPTSRPNPSKTPSVAESFGVLSMQVPMSD